MDRVMVIGTSCAGKSTLARRIAEALDAPYVELDAIYWGPNWRECPTEEFRSAIQQQVALDRWVIDGNYSKVRDIILSRATHAVWLNYAFPVVFWRALTRTSKRVIFHEELFNGNRETFWKAFLSRESILWWVITTYHRRKRSYRELFSTGAGANIALIELRRPQDADALVENLQR